MGMLHSVADVDRKIRQNTLRFGVRYVEGAKFSFFLRKIILKVEARDQILDYRLKFPGENGQKWVKSVAIVSVTVKLGLGFFFN